MLQLRSPSVDYDNSNGLDIPFNYQRIRLAYISFSS